MHANEKLITSFYEAFARRDGAAMGQLYADDARFEDPVFQKLDAREARAMWAMLTGRSKDLEIKLVSATAGPDAGKAHWEAFYTFSTGRRVHNVIHATFRFAGGRIVAHEDVFDFYAWLRQALGPTGLLLGWTPFLKAKVRKRARAGLDDYMALKPAPSP
jgi:ketosteroid isomerase-like protein